jgi:hypothetical protein
MSFAGLHTFNQNLKKIIESKTFQDGDESTKVDLVCRLLNSKYGLGFFGLPFRTVKLEGDRHVSNRH